MVQMISLAVQICQVHFKDAVVDGKDANNYIVKVTLDGDKLTNFKNFDNKTLTTKIQLKLPNVIFLQQEQKFLLIQQVDMFRLQQNQKI